MEKEPLIENYTDEDGNIDHKRFSQDMFEWQNVLYEAYMARALEPEGEDEQQKSST